LRFGKDRKAATIVFAKIFATLWPCRQRACGAYGMIMSTTKFEPFGELLPENGLGKREQPKAASAILSAIGQSFFWLLVVAIVVTRVAYFSPAPSFSPHAASTLIHSAQR
jgi:hypothetical protein